jgi:nucleotide-binding universal stress UspA family protein
MKTDPILVPLDLTGCAYEVVEAVSTLASKLGSRVILMNVVQVPAGVNPYATLMMDEQEWHTAREILDQDARALMEPFRMQLAADDVKVTHFLGHGDVVEAILTAAREVDAGMVVMGTHGRKGLERFMLGSVAEQVMRRSTCPVMVVRSQDLTVHPGPSETQKRVEAESEG